MKEKVINGNAFKAIHACGIVGWSCWVEVKARVFSKWNPHYNKLNNFTYTYIYLVFQIFALKEIYLRGKHFRKGYRIAHKLGEI